jgi:hypothetical protein
MGVNPPVAVCGIGAVEVCFNMVEADLSPQSIRARRPDQLLRRSRSVLAAKSGRVISGQRRNRLAGSRSIKPEVCPAAYRDDSRLLTSYTATASPIPTPRTSRGRSTRTRYSRHRASLYH